MKPSSILAIVAGVLLIALVVVPMNVGPVTAQETRFPAELPGYSPNDSAPSSPTGRYQISAYAGVDDSSVHHGCYVVDTTTGAVWHVAKGAKAEPVVDKLP